MESLQPLSKIEQDTIFQVGAEMGRRFAESMGACLSLDHSPEVVSSTVKAWDEKFRTNLKELMAMTPEELERHEKHRQELERKEQTRRDYERAKRKLHDAQWTLRRARDAAMKEGMIL